MKKHMHEMEGMNMKKIAFLVLALILALTAFSAALAEGTAFPEKPVIGIAWRADTDSEFFTNMCRAVEAAGGEWVMLDQVFSSDLNYDAEGHLTGGKTEMSRISTQARTALNAPCRSMARMAACRRWWEPICFWTTCRKRFRA